MSNEKTWLLAVYKLGIILPGYIEVLISHYKNPYQPTSIINGMSTGFWTLLTWHGWQMTEQVAFVSVQRASHEVPGEFSVRVLGGVMRRWWWWYCHDLAICMHIIYNIYIYKPIYPYIIYVRYTYPWKTASCHAERYVQNECYRFNQPFQKWCPTLGLLYSRHQDFVRMLNVVQVWAAPPTCWQTCGTGIPGCQVLNWTTIQTNKVGPYHLEIGL